MKKKVRWGILGTASIAEEFVKAVGKSTDSIAKAVASRDLNKAKSWAQKRGISLYYGSYDEMLKSGEIDVIYNPLPNSLHAEWTIKSLERGLPVLCEKPFTLNKNEASQVFEISLQTGKIVAEAFMYRFHPIYKKIKDLITSGEIGSLTSIYSVFNFYLDDRSQIPANKELGGGSLMDVGCYCVNVSRLITDMEPQKVSAIADVSQVDDTLIGSMEFDNGIISHFECSIASYEKHYLRISGTKGIIEIQNPWFPGLDKASFTLYSNETSAEMITDGADCYVLEIKDFVDAYLGKKKAQWDASDAVQNMAVIDALFLSIKENKVVCVDS